MAVDYCPGDPKRNRDINAGLAGRKAVLAEDLKFRHEVL